MIQYLMLPYLSHKKLQKWEEANNIQEFFFFLSQFQG